MSDCTVNIADFRAIHVMNAPRLQELSRRATTAPEQSVSRHVREPLQFRVGMGMCTQGSRVLNIARVREMRSSERSSGSNGGCRAKVLPFADEAVRMVSVRPISSKPLARSEDFDPIDNPPAA
jgi:hypothetical protein